MANKILPAMFAFAFSLMIFTPAHTWDRDGNIENAVRNFKKGYRDNDKERA